ncbi:unnamed protein product [Paramecium primaurelia]|uniref:EF-hand domain-containing protein n=2 Tax=Paramecium TaxID=5884 RepID=A0A8S1TDJ3_9CILI|nr:unnamed protein product [Paramecium primaurelia]CAD8149624.1 unnamed protein product [Paramecium pentaurelia]
MNNNEAKPQTHQAKARLKAARSIFELADTNKDGFITFDEVPKLLIETNKLISEEKYVPTNEEIESWIKMTDLNKDKKVSIHEFEVLILKALQAQGIDLDG